MATEFDRSKKLDELSSWAQLQGIGIDSCEIRTGTNGAGLFTTHDINAGDILVTVPYKKVLSRDTVVEYAKRHKFLSSLLQRDATGAPISQAELAGISDKDVLTRFFIAEILTNRRGDTNNNEWATWVESLPALREMNLPIAWDRQDVEDLVGTSIYDATLSKVNFLKFRYKRFFESTEVRELIKEYVTTGPAPKLRTESDIEFAFKDWVLIESWISSRSLEVFYHNQRDLCLGLVPIVDMANHDSVRSNAKYELDFDKKTVTLIATGPVSAGVEVLIDYGADKGAGEFVFSYGFIPSTFKDAVTANFIIPDLLGDEEKSETNTEESEKLMVLHAKDKMFGTVPRLFCVRADGTWSSNYLAFLALPADEFAFDGPDGTEVEFRGTSVSELRAGGAQMVAEKDTMVMERAASMAESLVQDILRPELEQDADMEQVPSTGGAHVAGQLALLERLLLAKFKLGNTR